MFGTGLLLAIAVVCRGGEIVDDPAQHPVGIVGPGENGGYGLTFIAPLSMLRADGADYQVGQNRAIAEPVTAPIGVVR